MVLGVGSKTANLESSTLRGGVSDQIECGRNICILGMAHEVGLVEDF